MMETFYDIGSNDLKELWDNDLDPAMEEALDGESEMNDWFCRDTKSGVVLHDRLMTDAALGTLPIKTEHSYSLNSDGDSPAQSPRDMHSRVDDMEDECFPAIPLRNAWSGGGGICTRRSPPSPAPTRISARATTVKSEPLSRPGSPCSQASSCPDSPSPAPSPAPASPQHMHMIDYVIDHTTGSIHLPHGTLRRGTPLLLNTPGLTALPKLNIKLEPNTSGFGLPPTPPSSLSSEDSEGGHSPSPPPASTSTPGPRSRTTHIYTPTHHQRQPIHTPLISSQPKGSTGTLELTDEEKRTLLAEGYPVPTRLPLTKTEEKSLKKIRRKIKNKISAQESRRKKKEYMDQLERKVEILAGENSDYRKRVESLEQSNANLLNQLAILQAAMTRVTRK